MKGEDNSYISDTKSKGIEFLSSCQEQGHVLAQSILYVTRMNADLDRALCHM